MAIQYIPIAKDESLNTTEQTPRNIADVLAEGIGDLIHAVSQIAPQTTYDLDDLGDVDITSPSNGQVLKYNGSTQKWENGTGGGFSALLVITAGTGLTVTASKGGDTYTATEISTGTYEVSVDSAGTWTVSDGSNTATVAVSASTTYYVTIVSVPDGSTVTPTDDISIWLACGQRSEAYTTLSQVLADSACLSALISDNNAMDYLVRSTTWASDVCGDSSAMSYIGLNNYASNTLLGDSTWCSAICNSTYFESVLNVKVPVMTSNTTPSGTCISDLNESDIWKAFDGDVSTGYSPTYMATTATLYYIGYIFTSPAKFYRADCDFQPQSVYFNPKINEVYLDAYINGAWVTEDTYTNIVDNANNSRTSILNGIETDRLRLSGIRAYYSANKYWGIVTRELQFYGRADV